MGMPRKLAAILAASASLSVILMSYLQPRRLAQQMPDW
jgi:hypothetical protein